MVHSARNDLIPNILGTRIVMRIVMNIDLKKPNYRQRLQRSQTPLPLRPRSSNCDYLKPT
jgi:hypothetical protein